MTHRTRVIGGARMGLICMVFCLLLAGCTSSSRYANPLGLDLDLGLMLVDEQRPVRVVYPAGAPRTSLADTYGPEWEINPNGFPPYKNQE